MTLALACLIAYLIGTIPSGLFIARAVMGIDIREHGSKNIGATNVFRVVGKKWGAIVMVLDAFKGWTAVTLPLNLFSVPPGISVLLGVSAILGNTFPVWLKFKGGKGVATSLGVFLALAPMPTLFAFALWWVVFGITHIISIASMVAAVFFPAAVFFFLRAEDSFRWLFPVSLVLMVFIFYTHRANIGRLLRGEEKKLF